MPTSPIRPSWSPRLLYLGLLLFALLLALAALAIRREWTERLGQARAEALFRLVEARTAIRPTETPGALAWLNLELLRYREQIADPEKARLYGEIAEHQDERRVPALFAPLGAALDRPFPEASARPHLGEAIAGSAEAGSLRIERLVEADGRWLALTRRRTLEAEPPPRPPGESAPEGGEGLAGDLLPYRLAPHLVAIAGDLRRRLAAQPLPALPGSRPPTLVRLYALGEEGSLLSLPAPLAAPGGAARAEAEAEAREIGKLPRLPTFFSDEFFFRFDFAAPTPQLAYSGVYLDIGGRGLVATLTAPLTVEGRHVVLALDLAFDVDWRSFARWIEPPMTASLALPPPDAGGEAAPLSWPALERSLLPDAPEPLRRAIVRLASGTAPAREDIPYLRHGVVEGVGAVAAFQVAERTWLAVLFPRTRSHLPWLPLLLSAVLLVALLGGFEVNRRRAERSQIKAERALQENQNLLNTMQVPLLVVDPNTDEVVFRNRAAADLGVEAGGSIAGMVADPRARAHYERMQVARPEPRRAYGLPLRVRGAGGEEVRYAIVRSVAVTAPIEALQADERHRLGIFFLLDEDSDLALWNETLDGESRRDERRRLAGLLTHGVDSLARVLARQLQAPARGPDAEPGGTELAAWLAGYIEARLRTTSWLLDRWDLEPPFAPDCTIEAAHARATIGRLQAVFACAARDLELRTRLHWGNGVLAGREGEDLPVFALEMDWPEAYVFTSPVRGGFGFFLTEALVNAVRHGRPGSTPVLRIALDRVRRELEIEVENESHPPVGRDEVEGGSYGGRRILERLARLFDWHDLRFLREERTFRVSWRVRVSERRDPAKAD